jgi:hypothetical protein
VFDTVKVKLVSQGPIAKNNSDQALNRFFILTQSAAFVNLFTALFAESLLAQRENLKWIK